MEVGICGVLDMSRVYLKTLFGPMFYSWWNCPLMIILYPDRYAKPRITVVMDLFYLNKVSICLLTQCFHDSVSLYY